MTNATEINQASLTWKTVNEITGRKRVTKAKIKAISQEERLNKWKWHFKDLLGKEPFVSDTPIQINCENELAVKMGPFNECELAMVLKKLKKKKAGGLDRIPPEVWKTGNLN